MQPSSNVHVQLPPAACRGFSLVEVAIALGILSFAVIAIVGTVGLLLEQSRKSAEETRLLGALSVVQSLIESAATTEELDALRTRLQDATFSETGEEIPSGEGAAFFRIRFDDVSPEGWSPRHRLLQVSIGYPGPTFPNSNEILFSWYGKEV